MNKQFKKNMKVQIENDKKISLLSKELKAQDEINLYIKLNRLNLPKEKEWDELLSDMIKELLEIGWSTDIKINTRITYGSYRIELITENSDLRMKSHKIINKFIEKFETENL
ncbi:hypothetical protein C8C83_0828 [Flavobacterium sp. 90]|uniref:hypothetical protein n=1 Tax=unclassified Flavobacterium TaxID=196869 RepID=UPI000EB30FC9|nr:MULTISPECIES: hypothetical protein [unclassified Flavobacterium]RKR09209.1 hypothetical protein C8C82_1127 [Flavobacterium sp. 81]TCK52993.1 hypothetical protein C8C83_0828 [Flavobacterium sp. 90]